MNIAFHTIGGRGWTCGPIYLRALLHALSQVYGRELGLWLMVQDGQQGTQEYVRSFSTDGLRLCNMPQRWTPLWAISGMIKRLLLRDMVVGRILRKCGIDAVFGLVLPFQYPKIATLSLLPDLQHVQLPEMFGKAERLSRDRIFLQSAKLASRVVLFSEAVKKDFQSFAPMYAHKARVLRPVSYVPPSIYDLDLKSILNSYQLPEKFVFLPNQFWKHKNHELAFRAVKILREKGIRIVVVCSGYPVDYRHPNHFASLSEKLKDWAIRDRVVSLGLIPHEHVFVLMRQSICVLNPSLFEGWGMTIDEARSMGKQVVLSDIPAHREQNPSKAVFFDPHEAEELAAKLADVWRNTGPGPDLGLEMEARQCLESRLRAYAVAFVSVAKEAAKEIKG